MSEPPPPRLPLQRHRPLRHCASPTRRLIGLEEQPSYWSVHIILIKWNKIHSLKITSI